MYLTLVGPWIQSAEPQESHSVQSLSTFSFTGVITKAIYKSSEEDKKEEEVKKTLEQHDNIVTHYKNMIREQVSTSISSGGGMQKVNFIIFESTCSLNWALTTC